VVFTVRKRRGNCIELYRPEFFEKVSQDLQSSFSKLLCFFRD
jgi:hypothetical protein